MSRRRVLHAPKGFLAGGIRSGIKISKKHDLGMILCGREAVVAATLTTNRFQAAPVQLCRERLARAVPRIRGIVVNSGNANALTGAEGLRNASTMTELAEQATGCPPGSFLAASTGIIGRQLPMNRILEGIPQLVDDLSTSNWLDFARAIMTTDLTQKISNRRVRMANGKTSSILGIAKGSGMIQPNMATMLAFICTDYPLQQAHARGLLKIAVDRSFNCLTVDGQTSTNDMALLMGSVALPKGTKMSEADHEIFLGALTAVCQELAQEIAYDGEGATKLIEVRVSGAKTESQARQLALEVANSPLVKTAVHGHDPNWGRITQALGKAGVAFDPGQVSVRIMNVPVLNYGLPCPFDRNRLSRLMKKDEIMIDAVVGPGKGGARVWTCDFSEEYIKINAEYN